MKKPERTMFTFILLPDTSEKRIPVNTVYLEPPEFCSRATWLKNFSRNACFLASVQITSDIRMGEQSAYLLRHPSIQILGRIVRWPGLCGEYNQ
jgi:hypothetical protein